MNLVFPEGLGHRVLTPLRDPEFYTEQVLVRDITGLPSFMLVHNEYRAELYLTTTMIRLGSFVWPSRCDVRPKLL